MADIKQIIKKTLVFSLPGGQENVAIQVTTSLLNMVNIVTKGATILDLHVELFLEEDTIRDEVFPEMMKGVVNILRKRGIDRRMEDKLNIKLRFKEITIYKDKLKVDLFPYIPIQLRDRIRTSEYMYMLEAAFGFNLWVRHDLVLPTIQSDYSTEKINQENRAKNMYRAFSRGKVNGVPYKLDTDYIKLDVIPNYQKFDLVKNVITPHFRVVILTHEPETEGDLGDVMQALMEKFSSLGIIIRF